MVDFACRANRLFLRATCMKQSGVYAFVQSLSRMDVAQRDRFDVRVVKPKGVLEVVTAAKEGDVMTPTKESEVMTAVKEGDVMTPTKESETLDCVCDNKCGRYYVSER